MPNYEYKCRDCQQTFTVKASIKEKSEGLNPVCPDCKGKDVFQVFTSVGIIGKGGSGQNSCSSGSCGSCSSC